MEFFNRISYGGLKTTELLRSSIEKYAVTHLTDVPEETDLETFYSEIASCIGFFIKTDMDPNTVEMKEDSWGEIRYSKEKAKKAYRYSDKRHPLHTDYSTAPIDFGMTLFFCDEAAVFGGATLFLDSNVLVESLKVYDPELLEKLRTTEIELSRQGLNRTKRVGKIIDFDNSGIVLNWNYFRVAGTNDESVREMAEQFHTFLEEKIVMGGLTKAVKLKKGEAVFFHDCRVLHGRYAFIGDRCLKRGVIVIENIEEVKAAFKQISASH